MFDENTGDNQELPNTDAAAISALVGSDKMYKTEADLAKALQAKEDHIKKLEKENGGMREDLARLEGAASSADKLDEVIKQLTAGRSHEGEDTPALSREEVRKLVNEAVTSSKTEEVMKTNINKAQASVLEKYKDEEAARAFIKEKAAELGMSTQDLQKVAAKSPQGFLRLVGMGGTTENNGDESNRFRSSTTAESAIKGDVPKEGTVEYYSWLRRNKPSEYWRPSTQVKLAKL